MAGVLKAPVTIPAAVNEVHAVGAQCAAGQQWSAHPSLTSTAALSGAEGGRSAFELVCMPWQGIPSTSGAEGGVCPEPADVSGATLAAAKASEMGCAHPGVHDDATSGIATSPRHVICRMRRSFIRVSLPQQHHDDLHQRSQAGARPNANSVDERRLQWAQLGRDRSIT